MDPLIRDILEEQERDINELRLRVENLEGMPLGLETKVKEYNPEQCKVLLEAVFGPKAEEVEDAEMDVVDATLDYLEHYDTFNIDGPMGEKQLREWGTRSHALHTAMRDAAKKLSSL